jgi:DNA-binding NarL/FixJ family response regulator
VICGKEQFTGVLQGSGFCSTYPILMTETSPIRVLVVDDQMSLRKGIAAILKGESDIRIVGEAQDGAEAVGMAARLVPHVVLMDVRMPGMDGIEATARITGACRDTKVVILSQHEHEEYVKRAMKSGASGYLLKCSLVQELSCAIRKVYEGGIFFTPSVGRIIVDDFLKGGSGAGK